MACQGVSVIELRLELLLYSTQILTPDAYVLTLQKCNRFTIKNLP